MTESQDTDPKTLDSRRRRLIYRARHRGTHENDLLIGDFVGAGIAGFSQEELEELENLLERPDTDLADWLTGRQPIPADADSPMLRRIRQAALRRCV